MNNVAAAFVFDFENTVPKSTLYEENPEQTEYASAELAELSRGKRTRVWMFTGVAVGENLSQEDVMFADNIADAVEIMSTCRSTARGKHPVGYFHNLDYDVHFIVDHLMRSGYVYDVLDENQRTPKIGTFTMNMTEKGKVYSMMIRFHNNRVLELRDSNKIMPGKVEDIAKTTSHRKLTGTIDYAKDRPEGYVADVTERAYAANDVLVISEALFHLFQVSPLMRRKQTIGSAALEYFKRFLLAEELGLDPMDETHWTRETIEMMNLRFDRLMGGELVYEDDEWFRRAYAGGFTYVNRQNPMIAHNQIVDLRHQPFERMGCTYDVNSLYPSVMFDHEYPVGEPTWHDPSTFRKNHPRPYYVEFEASFEVKEDHIPFVQLKGSPLFGESEHVRSTNWERVNRVMSKPDFELFLEQYDVHDLHVIRWCDFSAQLHVFDSFIGYFYEMKSTRKKAGDAPGTLFAKLMLNNLYGKLAQAPNRSSGAPFMADDDVVHVEEVEGKSAGAYIPIGAYITAYARGVTVRAAQSNYAVFLYADTDSIHLAGPVTGIEIHPFDLGCWDHESTWDLARFTRQKGYIEREVDPKTHEPHPLSVDNIKAAGAPNATKERMLYDLAHFDGKAKDPWAFTRFVEHGEKLDDLEILTRFTFGKKEAGKLMRKQVPGGVILAETTFSISVPEGTPINPATGLAYTEITVVD